LFSSKTFASCAKVKLINYKFFNLKNKPAADLLGCWKLEIEQEEKRHVLGSRSQKENENENMMGLRTGNENRNRTRLRARTRTGTLVIIG
jgi:hypothetical protein